MSSARRIRRALNFQKSLESENSTLPLESENSKASLESEKSKLPLESENSTPPGLRLGCRAALKVRNEEPPPQRLHNPLVKEYTLNHNRNPNII